MGIMDSDIIRTIIQFAIFALGTGLIPYLRAMNSGLVAVRDELHNLKIEFVEIKTRFLAVESMQEDIRIIKEHLQTIEVRLEASGMLEAKELQRRK